MTTGRIIMVYDNVKTNLLRQIQCIREIKNKKSKTTMSLERWGRQNLMFIIIIMLMLGQSTRNMIIKKEKKTNMLLVFNMDISIITGELQELLMQLQKIY